MIFMLPVSTVTLYVYMAAIITHTIGHNPVTAPSTTDWKAYFTGIPQAIMLNVIANINDINEAVYAFIFNKPRLIKSHNSGTNAISAESSRTFGNGP
jgi:hypothetical protein